MITSPKQYNPDSREAKLERAVDRLKVIKNATAQVVCFYVSSGHGDLLFLKRQARISLAASKGLLILLKKRIEGR